MQQTDHGLLPWVTGIEVSTDRSNIIAQRSSLKGVPFGFTAVPSTHDPDAE